MTASESSPNPTRHMLMESLVELGLEASQSQPLDAEKEPLSANAEPSGRWRKRPVVVDAWRVDVRSPTPHWIISAFSDGVARPGGPEGWGNRGILIDTLEGVMLARLGDWIIKGVAGELYPCKPEIFAATYEPADTADRPAMPREDQP